MEYVDESNHDYMDSLAKCEACLDVQTNLGVVTAKEVMMGHDMEF